METKCGNRYLYSKSLKQFISSNTILNTIVEEKNKNISNDVLKALLVKDSSEVEVDYYLGFYNFLYTNGFFNRENNSSVVKYKKEDLIQNISNIRQVVFEVTDACNLSCKYCGYGYFYNDYDNRSKTNLTFNKAKLLLDYIFSYHNTYNSNSLEREIAIGFYGGEPLLNMRLIKQIVSYIESLNLKDLKIKYGMTTNGMLLDKYYEYLSGHNFSLLVSLDGDRKGSSYRVTNNGKESFDRVFSNLKLIEKEAPSLFKTIRFNSVLHDRNSVASLFKFFKMEFGKDTKVSELSTIGIEPSKKEEFLSIFNSSLKSSEQANISCDDTFKYTLPETRLISDLIFRDSNVSYQDYSSLLLEKKQVSTTGTCPPFLKRLFLSVSGKLLPCEKVDQRFAIGSVSETSVNVDFEEVANSYNKMLEDLYSHTCVNCLKNDVCDVCVLHAYDQGNLNCSQQMWRSDFLSNMVKKITCLERSPEMLQIINNSVKIR